MNLAKATKNDNIVEVLGKIIDFTVKRAELINKNIKSIDNEDYKPVDFDVDEFAEVMAYAVYQHSRLKRLVFKDAYHTSFGKGGEVTSRVCVDQKAKELFENDIESYVKAQKKKLAENATNQALARHILRHYEAS